MNKYSYIHIDILKIEAYNNNIIYEQLFNCSAKRWKNGREKGIR
jgi:hypothetical protein